jgi:putative ABC transport system permease protein
MIKNYIVIAFRALRKHRFYTVINVAGLSVGIAGCLVILLFVVNELGYDRFHAKGDRIYRLNTEIKFGSNHIHLATGYPVMAELFRQNYPEIESVVRFRDWGHRYVHRPDVAEKTEENVIWADSTFFDVFSVPVLEGNGHAALRQPNTIAISKAMADKYFPGSSALGQSFLVDDINYSVSAVYATIPANSHFHFDILRSMAGLDEIKSLTLIGGSDFHVYVLLRSGASIRALQAKFPAFVQRYVMPQIVDAVGSDPTYEKFEAAGNRWVYTFTPLRDIHLYSSLLGEFEANGSIAYVYLFSSIAIFILIIACINFMNLSTARSANRAREVGVRKVLGSQRQQLVKQFLSESFAVTLFSFLIALVIAYLFLPVFNTLAGKQLVLPLSQGWFYGLLLITAMGVALLAGLYPAFFLSAFKPVSVLKGKLSEGLKSGRVRSGLVIFQFVISIFLIIATITVNRQLHYIQTRRLGFDKDQLVLVKQAFLLGNNLTAFKNEMLRNSSVRSATVSGYLPVDGTWRSSDTFWNGSGVPTQVNLKEMVNMQSWRVDLEYLSTLKMKMKLGRWFSADFPSDSSAIILNETAMHRFNLEGDPVGKKVSRFGGNNPDGSPDKTKINTLTVIGVVEDFHFESLRDNIGPLSFQLQKSDGCIAFRFEGASASGVIAALESTWKKLAPGSPLRYSFLDQDFGRMYASEQKLGEIFSIFATLAIFIACLGLFALTAFTAEQRTKEIGIRKALGATVNSIVLLLSKDFGRLIIIAFVVAVPFAVYAVNQWLAGYAYRTEIGIWVYAMAGGMTFIIALATMSYQSVRAARANPVDSLRSE